MIHLFYLFSVFRISLAYKFYYTVKSSYEEQNFQKRVSELVQNLRIVLKNEKSCIFSSSYFLATFYVYIWKTTLIRSIGSNE